MLTLGRSWRESVLERLNMQNQAIFELYTEENKSKYSSNPKDILLNLPKKL